MIRARLQITALLILLAGIPAWSATAFGAGGESGGPEIPPSNTGTFLGDSDPKGSAPKVGAPLGEPPTKGAGPEGGAPGVSDMPGPTPGPPSPPSVPPASPPPTPAMLADKFGKNWSSTKHNQDLLKDSALVDDATKDGNLSQEDSYILVSNVLYGCVETSAGGRKDDVCKDDPDHPECVGIAGALKNATNCLEYFTPATLGCKVYGTSEYGMDEWVAVGDQFQTQMMSCANSKTAFDNKKHGSSLENLTELIGAGNFLSGAPGAPSLSGALLAPQSTVSGNIKPDLNVSELNWDELSQKIKDGASYLGYQDGDILRASIKGESFSSIVTGSPFAQKLNYVQKAKLEEGLADSAMIAKRVAQDYRTSKGEVASQDISIGNENASAAPESNTAHSSYRGQGDSGLQITSNQPAQEGAQSGAPASASLQAGNNPAARAAASATQAEVRMWLEAERIEAVARAAAQARAEKTPYRAPASASVNTQSSTVDLLDTSLFQRVNLTYRRHSPGMRSLDSRNGDLIRSIERPEIFRNL